MLKTFIVTVSWLSFVAIAAAADKGETVEMDGLKSTAPATWKKGKPENQMQFAVFKLPKAESDKEDASLTIYFFMGQGGTVDQNVKRWQGMFKAPASENSKPEKLKVGDVQVTTIDVSGTYLFKPGGPFNPNAKTEEKPDFRLIGVVFESKNGPYFMRLVGPAKTVEKNKKDFDEWLKNFK